MNSGKTYNTLFAVFGLIALSAAFLAGYFLHDWRSNTVGADYPLLSEADELITEYYLGELPDAQSRQHGMIEGMLRRLDDPHTAFFEPALHELQMDNLLGEYGGIGVHLTAGETGKVHLIPYPDGPAARSGILPGDDLLSVDGVTIQEFQSLDHILATLHGAVGSEVRIVLKRHEPREQKIALEIERENINIPSVSSYIHSEDARIGVIKANTITDRTADEVERDFSWLCGLGMEALVLDLRHNPGGLLDEAIRITRFFLKEGIVLIERRNDGADITYQTERVGIGSDLPMAILVDSGTASAAEAIAAAIQTNRRAPLFGSKTFGKGSVQVVLELSDGSSLHVTTSRWYTPSGETYNGEGLTPDYYIEASQEQKDPVLLEAIRHLTSQLEANQ